MASSMHSLWTHPRRLAGYLLVWALAGAAAALAWGQWGGAASAAGLDRLWVLAFALPTAVLSGLAALAMDAVCRSRPLRPAKWISGLLHRLMAAGLLAGLVTLAAALWNATGALWGPDSWVNLSPAAWLGLALGLAALFTLAALVHDAMLAQHSVQAAAQAEAQARLLARDMEIKALRSQIDPHFLFNSLNSINALIGLDPPAARAMTLDLAEFFRQTLKLGERRWIRLDEELVLLGHYLAIEQRRMGSKLAHTVDANPACRQAWVPPLLLQTLVENAIKHGIRSLDEGGVVEIGARRQGSQLLLWVSNPVQAQAAPDASGLGQGLRQLQARLRAQAEGDASVALERTPQRFTVRLSLPWQNR